MLMKQEDQDNHSEENLDKKIPTHTIEEMEQEEEEEEAEVLQKKAMEKEIGDLIETLLKKIKP